MDPSEIKRIKRALLLVPCETKEDLHRWIRMFLDIDLPDCTVDPESNSNPMDFIWEIYNNGLRQNPEFARVMAYSAREAMKTLSEAILELLFILHLEREVGHMAAIKFQALNAQRYIKDFCRKPFIRDFITSDNDTRIEFTRYVHPDGRVLSPVEWEQLDEIDQEDFECKIHKMTIIVATLNQTNSLHVPLIALDELDLCPPGPLEEVKMVPTQGKNGEPSITVITSSRKFAFGPVQKELDNAEKSGLHVRHWNIIDVSESCPTTRHCPEKPKLPIYVDKDILSAVSEEEFNAKSKQEKESYVKDEGYWGCLNNCRLFAVCRGRLATEQKSKSKMLKKLTEIQTKFKAVDADYAKAQLMCWSPSKEGMIYPRLDPHVHQLTAKEMALKITGEEPPEPFEKFDLIQLLRQRGLEFVAGIDHGHTHLFACTIGALDGNILYIVDVIAAPELELSQKVDVLSDTFTRYGISPVIYADPEDPGSNKTLARSFNLRSWKKGPGSVVEGIQIVRMKLNPTMKNEPELFFLKGDPLVEFLWKSLREYHWKVDAQGNLTSEPDKVDDDCPDSLRYLVMNTFGKKGQLIVASGTGPMDIYQAQQNQAQQWDQQMKDRIDSLTEGTNKDGPVSINLKNKFYFNG